MKTKPVLLFSVMAAASFIATSAYAAAPSGSIPAGRPMGNFRGAPAQRNAQGPMIAGTITAISGTTITISGNQGFRQNAATAAFTVDASTATVSKFTPGTDGRPTSTPINLSDLQVGNTISVRGQINGTSIVATQIVSGQFNRAGGAPGQPNNGNGPMVNRMNRPTSTAPINFQSRHIGTITAIDGDSITITSRQTPNNQNPVASANLIVDASNAKITSGFGSNVQTLSLTDLAAGNTIEVTGTSTAPSAPIIATAIMKIEQPNASSSAPQMRKPAAHTVSQTASSTKMQKIKSIFSKIISSLKNLLRRFIK